MSGLAYGLGAFLVLVGLAMVCVSIPSGLREADHDRGALVGAAWSMSGALVGGLGVTWVIFTLATHGA